jgi:alpha-glucosidase
MGLRAPPPLWSLGYLSRGSVQAAVQQLAERHRNRDPVRRGLVGHRLYGRLRVFTWNADAFPDVDGMLSRLTDMGFRVITIIDRREIQRLLGVRPGS